MKSTGVLYVLFNRLDFTALGHGTTFWNRSNSHNRIGTEAIKRYQKMDFHDIVVRPVSKSTYQQVWVCTSRRAWVPSWAYHQQQERRSNQSVKETHLRCYWRSISWKWTAGCSKRKAEQDREESEGRGPGSAKTSSGFINTWLRLRLSQSASLALIFNLHTRL